MGLLSAPRSYQCVGTLILWCLQKIMTAPYSCSSRKSFKSLVAVDVQEELFPARVGRVPPTSKEFADQVAKSRWLRIQRLLHLRSNYDADIYIWGNPLKDALRAEELAAICTRKIQHSPPWDRSKVLRFSAANLCQRCARFEQIRPNWRAPWATLHEVSVLRPKLSVSSAYCESKAKSGVTA
jgi:hypothetical protein